MKFLVDVVERPSDGVPLETYEIEAASQGEAGTIAMHRFTAERPLQSYPTLTLHFRPVD